MLIAGLLDLIAPTRCAGCDLPGSTMCPACASAIVRADADTSCTRCGAIGAGSGGARCVECEGREFGFEAALAVGPFEPPLSRAITLYKDSGERRYSGFLGAILADTCSRWSGWPDVVVPVPPTRAARSRRGFDHTLPLARAVGDALAVPVERRLCVSGRRDQRALGRDARFANMAGAFSVVGEVGLPTRVLLVDDVMTTGATLDAASRALLAAGASHVRVIVLARA
ncbi:MAG: phosphoribosyltransferase family protein [Coriobacteriia bacterium]